VFAKRLPEQLAALCCGQVPADVYWPAWSTCLHRWRHALWWGTV